MALPPGDQLDVTAGLCRDERTGAAHLGHGAHGGRDPVVERPRHGVAGLPGDQLGDPAVQPGVVLQRGERTGPDGESAGVALLIQGIADLRAGGANADRLFGEARARLAGSGADHKSVYLDVVDAMRKLEQGDVASARRAVAEAEEYLRQNQAGLAGEAMLGISVTVGLLRGAVALKEPGTADALIELQRVEDRLMHADSGLIAAQLACGRARILLDAGRARLALDTVLPAVLALDAVRFTFADADRRHRWSAVVAEAVAVAFRAAAGCEDRTALAELIEVTRAHAVPLAAGPVGARPVRRPGRPAHTPRRAGACTGGGGRRAGRRRHRGHGSHGAGPAGRPAHAVGTLALDTALTGASRYHDPVRASEVVEWLVPSADGPR